MTLDTASKIASGIIYRRNTIEFESLKELIMYKIKYLNFIAAVSIITLTSSLQADSLKLPSKGLNSPRNGSLHSKKYEATKKQPILKKDDNKRVIIETYSDKNRFEARKFEVFDKKTELIWQDNGAAITVRKPWYTDRANTDCLSLAFSPPHSVVCNDTSGLTAANYCSHLILGGSSHWKLPSARELKSIIDQHAKSNHYLPKAFRRTSSGIYWTSTSVRTRLELAYVYRGNIRQQSKKLELHNVRCVRSNIKP